MTAPPNLARVLEALRRSAEYSDGACDRQAATDAARLLREMAADFSRYAWHSDIDDCPRTHGDMDCDCGLDAARERWRLP